MTTKHADDTTTMLGIVADLLRGRPHNRHTVHKATGKSLKTADRWIDDIVSVIPNARTEKDGRTRWVVVDRRDVPTKRAVAGACIAASVGSLFAGTQQARNLKDARDYLLAMRDESYGDLDRKFFFAPRGGEFALPAQSGDFDEIVDAVLTNHGVHFSYRHNDYKSEEITVTPLSLVIHDHQIYVVARRNNRAVRAFRFARMKDVESTDELFEYPSALEYDPVALFRAHFGINLSSDGPIEEVEIVLDEPWANYATSHRWHPSQRVERLEDGRVRVVITAYVCREIQAWALGFGEAATVVRPEALRTTIAERLAKAAAKYSAPIPLAKGGAAAGIAKVRADESHDAAKRKA